LKEEIQIQFGYPVQTQQIKFHNEVVGCNQKLRSIGIENASTVYLFIEDDGHDDDQNFTVEYNGYIELNSCVPAITPDKREADTDDSDNEDDILVIRIEAFSIHSESDGRERGEQIGIVCYQYNGKVEWTLNGIQCKSGDVVVRNVTSSELDGFEEMYNEIFGTAMDYKFVGNAFRIDKYGDIESLSEDSEKGIGDIELFWLRALIGGYRERGKRCIDIESYQRKRGRYRYSLHLHECDLCQNDVYIARESNCYSLQTSSDGSYEYSL